MTQRLFATYCSAEKNPSDAPMPAVERYISERITGVHAMAEARALAEASNPPQRAWGSGGAPFALLAKTKTFRP